MQALAITARGESPAVTDVPEPTPGEGEILVAVEAASVNGFDLAVAGGYMWDMLPHTFPVILGRDFAGTVEAAGEGAGGLAAGDRVAGVSTAMELGRGMLAEQIIIDAASAVRIPGTVTAPQAAAAGLAGVTALDLIDALSPDASDTVLVAGATGGVGVLTVQLAAARGARVIATARPGEASGLVRSLGAHEAADFTGDLAAAVRAAAPGGVTKVVHAAGDPIMLAGLLVPGGQLASCLMVTSEQVGREDITVTAVNASYTPAKLAGLLDQVATGQLTVPVTATYPLAKASDALVGFSSGKLGKIMVNP